MTKYRDVIAEATGLTDPSHLAAIEDIMCNVIFHGEIDQQSSEVIKASACAAVLISAEIAKILPEAADAGAAFVVPDPVSTAAAVATWNYYQAKRQISDYETRHGE
jgi:hypothetical protein